MSVPVYYLPVSPEAADDMLDEIDRFMAEQRDRMLFPWRYPDRLRFPEFDPFPRLTAALELVRAIPGRLRDARYLLRHGACSAYCDRSDR